MGNQDRGHCSALQHHMLLHRLPLPKKPQAAPPSQNPKAHSPSVYYYTLFFPICTVIFALFLIKNPLPQGGQWKEQKCALQKMPAVFGPVFHSPTPKSDLLFFLYFILLLYIYLFLILYLFLYLMDADCFSYWETLFAADIFFARS